MTNGGYANGPDTSRTVRETPFTLREWFVWRRLRWHLALLAAAIFFLGYLGPFGTYLRMPLGERMAYWVIAVAGNWSFALACILPAVARLSGRIPDIACVLGGSLAAAVPGTLLISALGILFSGALPETLGTGELFLGNALIHLVIGLIVWGTVELPMRYGGGAPFSELPAAGTPDRPAADPSAPPLLERLPAAQRGRLLHLQMRDHYVEIFTDRGSDLVLMRFGDALKELGGTEGMQVHRSHWIARAALKKVSRRAGRTVAHLANGAEVPVSRRYARALREANWV
ncbi:MAG: LytTR family DNA-binding domain-containing protein [Rhodospirillaceae bacterium]|nr:LytTR family DNA-binding domain-containing protein [Rhodospirillaceae bacterium]